MRTTSPQKTAYNEGPTTPTRELRISDCEMRNGRRPDSGQSAEMEKVEKFRIAWGDPFWDAKFTLIPNLLLDRYTAIGLTPTETLCIIHALQHKNMDVPPDDERAWPWVSDGIADCGLRIADCGFLCRR
jgi:hypothetical protein